MLIVVVLLLTAEPCWFLIGVAFWDHLALATEQPSKYFQEV
jgi:hypothetical protein